jgi:hypothetical protein
MRHHRYSSARPGDALCGTLMQTGCRPDDFGRDSPSRRRRSLLLTEGAGRRPGGYGEEELERAGAYRVYQDPADLLKHLDEVGIRQPA